MMGMYDSLYDADGHDWQTKAFDCELARISIGQQMPGNDYSLATYQVEVLGDPVPGTFIDAYATVIDGSLAEITEQRDDRLPLLDYFGGCLDTQPVSPAPRDGE